MQAKRKKHKKRNSVETHFRHPAQIFCEMLGHTCHKPLYENSTTKYQEVSSPQPSLFYQYLTNFSSHLSFMLDMPHFSSSTQNSQILIYVTSPPTEPDINRPKYPNRSFNYNLQGPFECVIHENKHRFSVFLQKF